MGIEIPIWAPLPQNRTVSRRVRKVRRIKKLRAHFERHIDSDIWSFIQTAKIAELGEWASKSLFGHLCPEIQNWV